MSIQAGGDMKREYILAPSILSADFTVLGEQVQKVHKLGAKHLHIDVMDGMFVPTISFGLPVVKSIRKCSDIFFDVHLMVIKPERFVNDFREAGADGITVHLETLDNVEETLMKIRNSGARVGVALNPGTEVEKIYPYLSMIDMVLLMTVEPGYGGQKYIHACTDKIRTLKAKIDELGFDIDIEVDGGLREDTIDEPLAAGANVIVAGSAVFDGDIEESVQKLLAKMK